VQPIAIRTRVCVQRCPPIGLLSGAAVAPSRRMVAQGVSAPSDEKCRLARNLQQTVDRLVSFEDTKTGSSLAGRTQQLSQTPHVCCGVNTLAAGGSRFARRHRDSIDGVASRIADPLNSPGAAQSRGSTKEPL
jgi:hypothetical protein